MRIYVRLYELARPRSTHNVKPGNTTMATRDSPTSARRPPNQDPPPKGVCAVHDAAGWGRRSSHAVKRDSVGGLATGRGLAARPPAALARPDLTRGDVRVRDDLSDLETATSSRGPLGRPHPGQAGAQRARVAGRPAAGLHRRDEVQHQAVE